MQNLDKNWLPLQSYLDLTIFTTDTYYLVFLAGMLLHILLVFAIKYFLSIGFSGKWQRTMDKMFNILAQFIIPSVFRDWDFENENGGMYSWGIVKLGPNYMRANPRPHLSLLETRGLFVSSI